MTTARTLLTIVRQYSTAAEMAGLRPQQIKYSLKKLSDLTGLSREAVREAVNEESLGFTKLPNSEWKITKDYTLKQVETNFKALSGDSVKLTWWSALPEYDWEKYGTTINVTKDEQIALSLVRKTLLEGKSIEDIGQLLDKPLGERTKKREETKEVVRVKEDCDKTHLPEWIAEVALTTQTEGFKADYRNALTEERKAGVLKTIEEDMYHAGVAIVQYGLAMVKEYETKEA